MYINPSGLWRYARAVVISGAALTLSGCIGWGPVGLYAEANNRPPPTTVEGAMVQYDAIAIAEALSATMCPFGMVPVQGQDQAQVDQRVDIDRNYGNNRFNNNRFRSTTRGSRSKPCVPAGQ